MREVVLSGRLGRAIKWVWSKMLRADIAGVTVGHTILYLGPWATVEDVPGDLRTHEQEHVHQAHLYGRLGFWARYLVELVRHGYRNNRFEVEARKAAGQE